MSQDQLPIVAGEPDGQPVLSQTQAIALESLMAGNPVVQAAKDAGISRYTVYRWLKADPHFRAAHNRCNDEIRRNFNARLGCLTAKAANVVDQALDRSNPWVALHLLRAVGLLQTPNIGPVDPIKVQRLDAIAIRKDERKLDGLEEKYGTEQDDVWPPVFGPDPDLDYPNT